jgi:hypothetical protein
MNAVTVVTLIFLPGTFLSASFQFERSMLWFGSALG